MTLSRFQDVVEKIRQKYEAIRAEDETDLPSLVDVPGAKRGELAEKHWCVGRIETEHFASIPRVCWIRGGGEIGPVSALGPIPDDLAPSNMLTPLYAADTAISCWIIGRSEHETECMWLAILRAVREVLGTAAGPQDFTWTTQQPGKAGLVNAGVETVEQLFAWPFIVPKEVKRTIKVARITHSDELHGAGTPASHTSEAHPEPEED